MSIPEREVLVRPNAEVRYETRTIQIRFEYKHSDGSKRRRGVNVDRKWIADEFGGGPLFIIEDRDGDDFWDFKHRAQALLMDELRAIAAEG